MERFINHSASLIQQQRIREDIAVSIKQLEAGEGIPLTRVMEGIRLEAGLESVMLEKTQAGNV